MNFINEVILKLVIGLIKWENQLSKLPDEIREGHSMLLKLLLDNKSEEVPQSLRQLLIFLTTPIVKWNVGMSEGLMDLKEQAILDKYAGINENFIQWADNVKSIEEIHQRDMFKFLKKCRETQKEREDKLYEEYYRKGRTFISPENAICKKIDFDEFLDEFPEELHVIMKKWYEPIPNDKDSILICPHCGYRVNIDQWNAEEKCTKVCQEYRKDEPPIRLEFGKEKYLILNKGLHKYALIPGIPERNIYERLVREFKNCTVTMYPEIDKYDIRIENNKGFIDIDVKDHEDPEYLVQTILENQDIGKFKTGYPVLLVIPNHRKSMNREYKEIVVSKFKEKNHNIAVLYESEIYEWISNYLYF